MNTAAQGSKSSPPSLLGVGARAIVLAGHLLNFLVRNSGIRRERLRPQYQQKYQQNRRLKRTFPCVFNVPRKQLAKYGIKPSA
jgi:hypothetical protein